MTAAAFFFDFGSGGRQAAKRTSMGLIITLVIGGVCGWLAAVVMHSNSQQGVLLNIIIGIFGALLGAFFIGSLVGGGNLLDSVFDIRTLFVALAGSVLLLAGVHLMRRRRIP